MSGPIVRTGTTPKFWANWEQAFGDKNDKGKAAGGKKKSASKASAKKKPVAKAKKK